jgi:hypothetical protein
LLTSAGIDTLPPADFTELLTSTVTVVESPVYWEAARHALRTVQQLREREIPLFPLLRGVPQRGALQQLPWKSLDEYQRAEPVFVTGLTLDNTQQLAMHMIFSSSAPIVQGPPGTGKSYTGLAALRLMLRDWNEDRDGPILVVCYSNHAVDAFLKELVDAEPDTFRLPPLREDGSDPAGHGTRTCTTSSEWGSAPRTRTSRGALSVSSVTRKHRAPSILRVRDCGPCSAKRKTWATSRLPMSLARLYRNRSSTSSGSESKSWTSANEDTRQWRLRDTLSTSRRSPPKLSP